MTRVLFIGDSWQGSSARSLLEALRMQSELDIADIAEDSFIPHYRGLPLRIVNRLLRPLQTRELKGAIARALDGFRPDAVMIYKGPGIDIRLVEEIQRRGLPVVNVFPDYSPHAYGRRLKKAMGAYDLVISTKPFHPKLWKSLYGYSNTCVCVPHGYDPSVHLWSDQPTEGIFDLALCATWRPEYERMMQSIARSLGHSGISVAIAGDGWDTRRHLFPSHWIYAGLRTGRAYGDFLRCAKIVIAPVNRDMVIGGVRQPGDEDTIRTYELAAAYCFFLHQGTDYASTVYDEHLEVPFWDDADQLAALIHRWLPDQEGRRAMAARAHARAVPAYSLPQRAARIVQEMQKAIDNRRA